MAITEETHAKLSNAKTNTTTTGTTDWTLKETIAAVNLEISATGVEALGTLKNEEVGGEMRASAESDANGIFFTGVKVTAPAGKGCKVFEDKEATNQEGAEGVFKTKPVKGHTTVVKDKENGVEQERHSVIIEPVTGNVLMTFWITCEKGKGVPEELEGTFQITGTFTCPTNGATIICNHNTVTEARTLRGKGANAALLGKATITAGKFPVTEPTHPVSVTTTTP